MMLTEICRHIRNYFPFKTQEGEFSVRSRQLSGVDILEDGDYYLILGSSRNDGVHRYLIDPLDDETFLGRVVKMSPPEDFLELCREIEEWCQENGSVDLGFVSESFGGYSYKRAEVGGLPATWRAVFKDRLNDFRKIC